MPLRSTLLEVLRCRTPPYTCARAREKERERGREGFSNIEVLSYAVIVSYELHLYRASIRRAGTIRLSDGFHLVCGCVYANYGAPPPDTSGANPLSLYCYHYYLYLISLRRAVIKLVISARLIFNAPNRVLRQISVLQC